MTTRREFLAVGGAFLFCPWDKIKKMPLEEPTSLSSMFKIAAFDIDSILNADEIMGPWEKKKGGCGPPPEYWERHGLAYVMPENAFLAIPKHGKGRRSAEVPRIWGFVEFTQYRGWPTQEGLIFAQNEATYPVIFLDAARRQPSWYAPAGLDRTERLH